MTVPPAATRSAGSRTRPGRRTASAAHDVVRAEPSPVGPVLSFGSIEPPELVTTRAARGLLAAAAWWGPGRVHRRRCAPGRQDARAAGCPEPAVRSPACRPRSHRSRGCRGGCRRSGDVRAGDSCRRLLRRHGPSVRAVQVARLPMREAAVARRTDRRAVGCALATARAPRARRRRRGRRSRRRRDHGIGDAAGGSAVCPNDACAWRTLRYHGACSAALNGGEAISAVAVRLSARSRWCRRRSPGSGRCCAGSCRRSARTRRLAGCRRRSATSLSPAPSSRRERIASWLPVLLT